MKQVVLILIALLILIFAGLYVWQNQKTETSPNTNLVEIEQTQQPSLGNEEVGLANPASVNCIDMGGVLEIVKDNEGNEFGMCKLDEDYRCEEWALLRDECDVEADSAEIMKELIAKGLDLSMMKVVVMNHTGKYIEGGVVPKEGTLGGGGYVFASKNDGVIRIIADGNGIITCEQLTGYEDLPSFMIDGCYDVATGAVVQR